MNPRPQKGAAIILSNLTETPNPQFFESVYINSQVTSIKICIPKVRLLQNILAKVRLLKNIVPKVRLLRK